MEFPEHLFTTITHHYSLMSDDMDKHCQRKKSPDSSGLKWRWSHWKWRCEGNLSINNTVLSWTLQSSAEGLGAGPQSQVRSCLGSLGQSRHPYSSFLSIMIDLRSNERQQILSAIRWVLACVLKILWLTCLVLGQNNQRVEIEKFPKALLFKLWQRCCVNFQSFVDTYLVLLCAWAVSNLHCMWFTVWV